MSIFGRRDALIDDYRRDETAALAQPIAAAIKGLQPESGVVIINHLTLHVNYASGGGAKVVVQNEADR